MSAIGILEETRARAPDLAEFLDGCCRQPLSFEGEWPNGHSASNHIHLWALESAADEHAWINLDYRVAFVEHIFAFWRGRLKGLAPYHEAGYRFYLYEDLAPTISVVAETPHGFPYHGGAEFVSLRDVLRVYVGRGWRRLFKGEPWKIAPERLLAAVERNAGSISAPTANELRIGVGELRILIEQMGLEMKVNTLRKRFRRRPAAFRPELYTDHPFKVYEQRLPALYR